MTGPGPTRGGDPSDPAPQGEPAGAPVTPRLMGPGTGPPAPSVPAQARALPEGDPDTHPDRRRTGVTATGAALVTAARRLVTTALLIASIPVAAALLVAVTVLGAPASLALRGPWRPTRMAAFLLLYLLVDLGGLLAAAVLVLRRTPGRPGGPGVRDRRAADAFALLARLLAVLRRAAGRLFHLEVELTPALPAAGRSARTPLVFLVRHAGLGDSFLLLQLLMCDAGLLPHTVLKGVLRADPCLDVLLGRVPHCFLPPARGTAEDAVAALAAGCGRGTRW